MGEIQDRKAQQQVTQTTQNITVTHVPSISGVSEVFARSPKGTKRQHSHQPVHPAAIWHLLRL